MIAVATPGDVDGTADARRVVVLGNDADLATVLTRLLRTDRLDVEVAYVRFADAGHPGYRLPAGAGRPRRGDGRPSGCR